MIGLNHLKNLTRFSLMAFPHMQAIFEGSIQNCREVIAFPLNYFSLQEDLDNRTIYWIGKDWIGKDWIGKDWIGKDWIGKDWIGKDQI